MNGLPETATRMTTDEIKAAIEQYKGMMRSALILYASETGTSEDAAHSLGRMFERLYFDVEVKAMDEAQLVSHVLLLSSGLFPYSLFTYASSVTRPLSSVVSPFPFLTFSTL